MAPPITSEVNSRSSAPAIQFPYDLFLGSFERFQASSQVVLDFHLYLSIERKETCDLPILSSMVRAHKRVRESRSPKPSNVNPQSQSAIAIPNPAIPSKFDTSTDQERSQTISIRGSKVHRPNRQANATAAVETLTEGKQQQQDNQTIRLDKVSKHNHIPRLMNQSIIRWHAHPPSCPFTSAHFLFAFSPLPIYQCNITCHNQSVKPALSPSVSAS